MHQKRGFKQGQISLEYNYKINKIINTENIRIWLCVAIICLTFRKCRSESSHRSVSTF